MRKSKILIAFMALFAILLPGCKSNNNSNNKPAEITLFEKGDNNAHLQEEEKATDAIRFHYHRKNDDGTRSVYRKWQIWAWDITNGGNGSAHTFTHYDDYGVYVDINLNEISDKQIKVLGFIVAITSDWTKDVGVDRDIEIPEKAKGGKLDVYLMTGIEKIYYDEASPLKNSISMAVLMPTSASLVRTYFNIINDFKFNKDKVSVKVNDEPVTDFTVGEYNEQRKYFEISFKNDLDLAKNMVIYYEFDANWIDAIKVNTYLYFDNENFAAQYTYEGNDLGVTFDNDYAPTKTTFKVWAPTSSKVVLNIYENGNYLEENPTVNHYEMVKGEKGVFSYTANSDLTNKYYTYTVTNSMGTNEVVDPYAKSAGVNGRRGMVVNFAKLNQTISGWASDKRPEYGNSTTDASVYEIHVRDMTINPNSNVSAANRGKFLGLAEKNTSYTKDGVTVSTGLSHMKELGVTHVQIQPFYDYSSVDETKDTSVMSENNYNWGYDPLNYNALEGSYATDAYDGNVRIKEFKQMVMAMHEEGLNINMDVVYNHTSSSERSNFNLLVPGYYYRTKSDGSFYNGSGCGNEFSSERSMGRKFIVDSVKFWTSEYHLSGFRFDLMGLIDNQTMIDVYNACHELYPNIMVYGEPWTGGSSKLGGGVDENKLSNQQTVQGSLAQSYFAGSNVLVGAFADGMRNAVRGDNNPGTGWVQGVVNSSNQNNIVAAIKGLFNTGTTTVSPQQVLNYVSCHDNYTLFDQLIQTNKDNRHFDNMYSQAEAIVFASQGVAFMQEGEDFLRTKEYEDEGKTKYSGNSYNVGDFINNMDYDLKIKNLKMFETFKEMIKVRKLTPELRLSTREEINNKVAIAKNDATTGNITFNIKKVNDSSKNILVIHALNAFEHSAVNGTILFDNTATFAPNSAINGAINLIDNQTLIIALNN